MRKQGVPLIQMSIPVDFQREFIAGKNTVPLLSFYIQLTLVYVNTLCWGLLCDNADITLVALERILFPGLCKIY